MRKILVFWSVFPLQAFFCGRSDYFKALLEDHFSESEELQTQPSIPVVTLRNISEDLFIRVLYYIYSDDTEVRPAMEPFLLCWLILKVFMAVFSYSIWRGCVRVWFLKFHCPVLLPHFYLGNPRAGTCC